MNIFNKYFNNNSGSLTETFYSRYKWSNIPKRQSIHMIVKYLNRERIEPVGC